MGDTSSGARLLETFRRLPADRLLVETDAPAMPPPPVVGAALRRDLIDAESRDKPAPTIFELPPAPTGDRLNHPANLAATYAALAELRGVTLESLAAQVEKNFFRLFGA